MDFPEIIIREIISVNKNDLRIGTHFTRSRPYSALYLKISGRTVYTDTRNAEIVSDPDRVVLIPKGSAYHCHVEALGSCIQIEFEGEALPDQIVGYRINCSKMAIQTADNLLHHWCHADRRSSRESCLSSVYQLLHLIHQCQENTYVPRTQQDRIRNSIDFLQDHFYFPELTVKMLADQSGISEIYFRKLFTSIFGMSPKKYLIMIRMEKAKELLRSDEIPIHQISEEVGFTNVYTFCKSFRKEVGYTPSEYRNNR